MRRPEQSRALAIDDGFPCANKGLAGEEVDRLRDDTFDKLTQLGRDRMATIQEFADVLKKQDIPIDLKDALRKRARISNVKVAKIAGKKTQQNKSGSVRKAR